MGVHTHGGLCIHGPPTPGTAISNLVKNIVINIVKNIVINIVKNIVFLEAGTLTKNPGFLEDGDFKTLGKRDGGDRKARELGISSLGKT